MAVFTETIKLEDGVSAPAKAASESVLNFGQRMALLRQNAALAKAATAGLADTLGGALPTATKKSVKEFENLTAAMLRQQTKVGTGKADAKAREAETSALAKATQSAAKDQEGINAITAEGTAAMEAYALAAAAAVGALVVGFGALVIAGAKFAISSSEAKQQMLSLFDAMGGGVVKGAEIEDMIDGVKAKFGIAKDSLIGYTNELHRLGVTDLGQLEEGIVALASAAALVKGGDQALLSFRKKIDLAVESGGQLKIATKQLASLGETGANVGDVAKVMGVSVEKLTKDLAAGSVDAKKFGDALQTAIVTKGKGPLDRMATSSANLAKLLSESFGDLFEDIDVEPFMAEVKKLFDIFGQGTESGKALKVGIGAFFKDVFAAATKVVPLVKHFLLDMIIYGLKAYIALKPIIGFFRDLAANKQTMDVLVTGFKVLGYAVVTVVAVLGAIIAAVAFLAYGLVYGAIQIYNLGAAITGFIVDAGSAMLGWVASAATAAYDFVAGLVAGIGNGASQVVGAVSGLADSATGAFKSALGIHSPSKVMMGLGGDVAEGTAQGIEGGSGDVHGAASGMAGAAVKGATSGGDSSGGGSSKGGVNVTVEAGAITIDGAGKTALEITETMISLVFERVALGAGL